MPRRRRPPPSQSSKTPASKAGDDDSDSDLSALSSPIGSPTQTPVAGPSRTRKSPSIGRESAASSALSDLDDEEAARGSPRAGDVMGEDGDEDDEDDGEGDGGRDDRSATSSTVPLSRLTGAGSDDDESDLTEEEEEEAEEEEEDEAEEEDEVGYEIEDPADEEADEDGGVGVIDAPILEPDHEMDVDNPEKADLEVKKETLQMSDQAEAKAGPSATKRSSRRAKNTQSPTRSASEPLTPPPPSHRVIPAKLPSSSTAAPVLIYEDGYGLEEGDTPFVASSPPAAAMPTSELTVEMEESVKASDVDDDAAEEEGEGEGDGDVTMRPGDVNGVLDALAEMGAGATVQDDENGNGDEAEGEGDAEADGDGDGDAEMDADAQGDEQEDEAQDGDDTDSVAFSAIPTRLTSHSSHAPLPSPAATKALLLLEIKFAALRDRLYMERMEEAAEEEEMVLSGSHPALAYLYKTLGERREKLHEAASRKHKQVVEELVRCRENEEAAVWSWWTDERDSIHWEEFEQTWSKRRRLAREKNELETPKIAKPIPRPMADRPLKLDWSSGYTPSKLSLDEASHDLALMENRRLVPPVPRTLPSLLGQHPESHAGPSAATYAHYPEEVERAPRQYIHASSSYPRQSVPPPPPVQAYASHPVPTQPQPQNPPTRTLSNPAQVFNSLASGAPPDPGVNRQVGSTTSSGNTLGRYPSNEMMPGTASSSTLLGSTTFGPPIPSPLGGLSTGTSSIGQSALGLSGRMVPTSGASFFQPPPSPQAAGPLRDIGRPISGLSMHETLGERIDRERREREEERMRERQKHYDKYREARALPFSKSQEDAKKEMMPNGNGYGHAVALGTKRTTPPVLPTTAYAESAISKTGPAADLEVKRESVAASSIKSPTPITTTGNKDDRRPSLSSGAGSGSFKVNGNGPTKHIEIINIHDPLPAALPMPGPPLPMTSTTVPPPSAAPERSAIEEDVSMIHPASPPSSSFEGPASVPLVPTKESDKMDVDEDVEPRKGEETMGGLTAPAAVNIAV